MVGVVSIPGEDEGINKDSELGARGTEVVDVPEPDPPLHETSNSKR